MSSKFNKQVYDSGNGNNSIPASLINSIDSATSLMYNSVGFDSNGNNTSYPIGSMSFINLNIDEYKLHDLEDFFDLPNKNYDIQDIVHKKKTMCSSVDKDYTLSQDTRVKIYSFLDHALERLVQHLSPITTGKPVTKLPVNTLSGDNGHFLINNPARDGIIHYDSSSKTGINLDDTGAPPGALNPLKVNTIKRAVNIDTRFRPNYFTTKSSDLQINLPTKIERAISMRLASIEIPISYYAINRDYGNNVFKVTWKSGGGEGVYDSSAVIIMPDGNYDVGLSDKTKAVKLEDSINTQLVAATAGNNIGMLNLRYEVSQLTGKSRFYQDVSSSVGIIPFKINFNSDKLGVVTMGQSNPLPLQGTLGWMLGFRSPMSEYVSNGKKTASGSDNSGNIISEGICNVQGTRYIYVSIDDYVNSSNNYFTAAFANSIMAPNIIARINVAELAQSTTVYHYAQQEGYSTELDRSRSYFGPVDIQKFRVALYDEYGRVLNLNNMDWSLELMFECIYS